MRAKSLILLVIALGCGMIAAVAVSKAVMDKGPVAVGEDTVEILVAVKDLGQGQKISAENVKLEKWPKSRVPEGASLLFEQVESKYTSQQLFAGEPILSQKLNISRDSFSTGVPPGYRIFDIPGNAGYIKPGDHVDILGTFELKGREGITESRTVMRNVKVHGIDGVTTRDSDEDKQKQSGKGGIFQLLVKETQLEALTLANTLGTLQLNLRPFGEDERDANRTDNGESFLSWVNESKKVEEVVLTQAPNPFLLGAVKPEAKNQIRIITPVGVRTYEWTESNSFPTEVLPPADGVARTPAPDLTANPYNAASGNVYSGYGGYTPTYPTSVGTSTPAPDSTKPATTSEAPKIN